VLYLLFQEHFIDAPSPLSRAVMCDALWGLCSDLDDIALQLEHDPDAWNRLVEAQRRAESLVSARLLSIDR